MVLPDAGGLEHFEPLYALWQNPSTMSLHFSADDVVTRCSRKLATYNRLQGWPGTRWHVCLTCKSRELDARACAAEASAPEQDAVRAVD